MMEIFSYDNFSSTYLITLSLTAWGLMKIKAEFFIPKDFLSVEILSISNNLLIQSSAFISSNASKHDALLPSDNSTYGSLNLTFNESSLTLFSNKALANESSANLAPVQLIFSANASKGEALPWTPLSPTLGKDESPRSL